MSKHTPGPWRVNPSKRAPETIAIYNGPDMGDGGGCYVAHVEGHADSWTTQSTAYLIAAAPDLLAACRAVADAHDKYDRKNPDGLLSAHRFERTLAALRDVIAKAEGR